MTQVFGSRDFALNELQNVVIHKFATLPAAGNKGRIAVQTSDDRIYFDDGSAWIDLTAQGATYTAGTGLDLSGFSFSVKYGTGSGTAARGDDSRLSDSRAPNGGAGGDLAGSYPAPTIGNLKVTLAKLAADTKNLAAGTPSLRKLGTGATDAAAGNDGRLTNSRAPSGSAGGDLGGNYPNPTVPGLAAKANLASPTFTGTVTVPNGAANGSAVNLGQLQAVEEGVKSKSARFVRTANVNLASPGTWTEAGATVAVNDVILLTAQTTTNQNGAYKYNGASSPLTRAANADVWDEMVGARWLIESGTSAGTVWLSNAEKGGTLGTSGLLIIPGPSIDDLIAGSGIDKTGKTISADATVARRDADNTIAGFVKATSASRSGLEGASTDNAGVGVRGGGKQAGGRFTGAGGDAYGIMAAASGSRAGVLGQGDSGPAFQVGSGSSALDADSKGKIINLVDPTAAQDGATKSYVDSAVSAGGPGRHQSQVGNNSATSFTVTHSLGTRKIRVMLRRVASPYDEVEVHNEATTTNSVKLDFGAYKPTTNQFDLTVEDIS